MSEFHRPQITLGALPKPTSEVVRAQAEIKAKRVDFSVILGDITEAEADAIVCPANPGFEYAGMGGVQVAIATKAGMSTFNEAEAKAKAYLASNPPAVSVDGSYVGVPLGFAASTTSGELQKGGIKRIIHVNNMRVRNEQGLPPCDEEVVRLSTASVLAVADAEGLKSVAIPALGTGIWGMSIAESMSGVMKGIKDYYDQMNPDSKIERVGFVVYAKPSSANASEMKKLIENDVYPRLVEQPKPKVASELAVPSYLVEADDTVGDGRIKWIGIETLAASGEMKKFLWWRNSRSDLTDSKQQRDMAAFIARIKIAMNVDAAVGRGVDLGASNARIGKVQVVPESDVIGVYIEQSKRSFFNFELMIRGLEDERELRRQFPRQFEEEYQKAMQIVPKLNRRRE